MNIKKKCAIITGAALSLVMAWAIIVPFPNKNSSTHSPHASIQLPKGCNVVVRYHDGRRNVIYYTLDNRLYCLDKAQLSVQEIIMANQYDNIEKVFINPENSRLFVVLDCRHFAYSTVLDTKQLWMINTFNNNYRKLAEGFSVKYENGCIIVSRGDYCLNSNARKSLRRWMVKDHYIDTNGKTLWGGPPYEMKEP